MGERGCERGMGRVGFGTVQVRLVVMGGVVLGVGVG